MSSHPAPFRRVLLSALASLSLAGCGMQGNGVAAEDRRTLEGFRSVRAEHSTNVFLTVSPGSAGTEVVVSGDANLVEEIETTVADGVLTIRYAEAQSFNPTMPLRVTATVPGIDALVASNSADVEVSGLAGEPLTVEAHNSADVMLKGKTSQLTLTTTESSEVLARDLEAAGAVLKSSGSSNVELCVKGLLDVTASGSSDVTYFCSPSEVKKSVSNSADVNAG